VSRFNHPTPILPGTASLAFLPIDPRRIPAAGEDLLGRLTGVPFVGIQERGPLSVEAMTIASKTGTSCVTSCRFAPAPIRANELSRPENRRSRLAFYRPSGAISEIFAGGYLLFGKISLLPARQSIPMPRSHAAAGSGTGLANSKVSRSEVHPVSLDTDLR